MSTDSRNKLIEDAARTSVVDREVSYGSPLVNLDKRTAGMWQAYFNGRKEGPINGTDVCILMVLLKVARLMETPGHYDSWKDIIGYASAGWELNDLPGASGTQPSRIAPIFDIR